MFWLQFFTVCKILLLLKSISRYLTLTLLIFCFYECRCLWHGTEASSQYTQAWDTRVAVPHQQTLSTFLFLSFAFYGMMTVAGSGHSSRELWLLAEQSWIFSLRRRWVTEHLFLREGCCSWQGAREDEQGHRIWPKFYRFLAQIRGPNYLFFGPNFLRFVPKLILYWPKL